MFHLQETAWKMNTNRKVQMESRIAPFSLLHDNDLLPLKSKESFQTLTVYYKDALTMNFMADVIRTGEDYAIARQPRCEPGIFLLILGVYKGYHVTRTGGEASNFYEFCLMDGGRSVFRARVHHKLSKQVAENQKKYKCGTIICVTDYTLVWLGDRELEARKVVMHISEFAYNPLMELSKNPDSGTNVGGFAISPSICCDQIDIGVIVDVMDLSSLVFMSQQLHDDNLFWTFMNATQMRYGHFLSDKISRADWNSKKRKLVSVCSGESGKRCPCQLNLGLSLCILQTFPLTFVKIGDVMARGDFTLLTPKQKRVALMKYYCVNFLSLNRGPYTIPSCLEDGIRTAFPDPPQDFFAVQWRMKREQESNQKKPVKRTRVVYSNLMFK